MAQSKKEIIVGAASVYVGPSGLALPAREAGVSFRKTLEPTDLTAPRADGSTYGTPAVDPVVYGERVTDWRNVGYTQDGFEIATDPSFGEVEVDQLLDSAKIFKDGMGLSISTTFAQATLKNLLVVWGQRADSYAETADERTLDIEGGALGEAPLERGLIAVGNGVEKDGNTNSYTERYYHAFRVLSVEGGGHTMARADATVLPVTFRALPGDDEGRYGVVVERLLT